MEARTWQEVTRKLRDTKLRRAVYDPIRRRKLIETTTDDFMNVLCQGGVMDHCIKDDGDPLAAATREQTGKPVQSTGFAQFIEVDPDPARTFRLGKEQVTEAAEEEAVDGVQSRERFPPCGDFSTVEKS